MKRKNDILILLLSYLVAIIFSIAIIRYVLFFTLNFNPGSRDRFVMTRVFFSAPVLIFIGALLRIGFRESAWHRFFGVLFMMGGIVWMAVLIKTIIEETA